MRIDLKQVEQDLTNEDIIRLVTGLGADRYEEKEKCIIFPTICHNVDPADASMKLYYYPHNHKFHCYTDCGENFNIFQLFEKRYELLHKEYDFYHDIILKIVEGKDFSVEEEGFQVKYQSIGDKYVKQQTSIEIEPIPRKLLNVFTFYPTVEWLNDGISVEAMKEFDIRYSISQNRIIIPHDDPDGQLIGIRGRFLNEEDVVNGKYMPVVIEGKMYNHPLGYNLYGLYKNKDNIRRKRFAIAFEGEKSVLQYETMYGRNNNIAVATCGSSLSLYQVKLLAAAGAERILVAYDNPATLEMDEMNKHYMKLKAMCERYKYIAQIGFIFDAKHLLGAKDSPTDRGRSVFEEVIKYSQWIS